MALLIPAVLAGLFALISLAIGAVPLGPAEVVPALVGRGDPVVATILLEIRLPRTLLALGIDKMRIVAQLAIETGLMAAVAALCSLGTGAMLSGYVSSRLLRDSGVAPLESLHVEALPPEQTMLILLLGCAVIAVALAVSCAAVLSKSPKSILSSMR